VLGEKELLIGECNRAVKIVGKHEVAFMGRHMGEHCDWTWLNQY